METFDDAIDLWKKGNEKGARTLNKNEVLTMTKARIKKQKNKIAQYALASWVWQFILYALAVNLIVRTGSNRTVVLVSLAGIALYVPFTIAYTKFFSRFIQNSRKRGALIDTIAGDLKRQYEDIRMFFNFKKRFDLIGIPVTGIFIVLIFAALNFIPQLSVNPLPGIIVYVIYLSAFIAAAYSENRKRFINPMMKLNEILDEIGERNTDERSKIKDQRSKIKD